MENMKFIESGGYTSAIVQLLEMGFTITNEKLIVKYTSENFVILAEKDGLMIRIEGDPSNIDYTDNIDNRVYFVSVYKLNEPAVSDEGITTAEAEYTMVGNPISCLDISVGWVIHTILKIFN